MKQSALIPVERIEKAMYLIRGEKVMLDRDLAELYQVETRVLNQAVGRNHERFPPDFMFELTREEIFGISQLVTSSTLKFSKRVSAFTEQGVAMLFHGVTQQAGSTRQHRDHARLCKAAPDALLECRPLATTG